MKFTSTILTCPGLGSSGPAHWQSKWEMLYGFTRVKQAEWDTPSSDDWVNTLNEYVQRYLPAEVILVGHSLACNTIANWANKFKVPIKGALLVSPSDTEALGHINAQSNLGEWQRGLAILKELESD